MKRYGIAALSAALLMTAGAASAHDISTKKLLIKEHKDTSKRQIQAFSKDPSVLYADADNPAAGGAAVHVYSATDDFCLQLPAGPEWSDKGNKWQYKNKATKNQIQLFNGKLLIKIRSGVSYTLADDGTQGTVNVQVQLGATGDQHCMRCTTAKKDDAKQYLATDCVAATCDAEPSACEPEAAPPPPLPGTVMKAVLPRTNGDFNFMVTPGLAGAEMACEDAFSGSHVCTYSELQAAEAAGDLDNITDPITNMAVTSLWAIDPGRPALNQCNSTLMGGTRWNYNTAHIDSGGDFVNLDNPAGTLGALVPNGNGEGSRNCGQQRWVGCCQ